MEDDLNARQPQLREPQWKTTPLKDDLNGRRPQDKWISSEEHPYGRVYLWKLTSMEALQESDDIS